MDRFTGRAVKLAAYTPRIFIATSEFNFKRDSNVKTSQMNITKWSLYFFLKSRSVLTNIGFCTFVSYIPVYPGLHSHVYLSISSLHVAPF